MAAAATAVCKASRTILNTLPCFTNLVSLELDLTSAFSLKMDSKVQQSAQRALNAAFAAFATRPNPLTSLALLCATEKLKLCPSVERLRAVCSTVKQLFLSADELLLMAYGADRSEDRPGAEVWQSHSVESYVVPYGPCNYLNRKIGTALSASLPSLSHLYVAACDDADEYIPGPPELCITELRNRLIYLWCDSVSLCAVPWTAFPCSSLVSLCICDVDEPRWDLRNVGGVVGCLGERCPQLAELAIINVQWPAAVWANIAQLISLPRLRFLQIETCSAVGTRQLFASMSPSLTHLALLLYRARAGPLLGACRSSLAATSLAHRTWRRMSGPRPSTS